MGEALTEKTAVSDKQVDRAALYEDHQMPSWREVFLYFLMLGFINVGGPVAQITMMFNHMVERRHWLSKDRFVKIMGFCHMLPGPEALQLAIYVGYLKRGLPGGILAGLTFIIPGAGVMILLSWLYVTYGITGAGIATFFVFLPSFVFVLAGARYVEQVRKNRWVRAFLGGASAAVVGVIFVVSLDLAPEALVSGVSVSIALASFALIILLKRDVALVAVGAMAGGVAYATVRAVV